VNSRAKNLILGVVAICGIIVLWGLAARTHRDSVTYSHFLQEVRAGEVANAIIVPGAAGTSEATIKLKDATMQRTVFPRDYRDAMVAMQERLVDIEIREFSSRRLLLNAAPFLLLLGIWILAMRGLIPVRKFPWPDPAH